MFDIGIGEVLVILVVALIVFGPDRLPTMAKQAASFVRDLRTMVANARRDLSSSVGDLGIDEEDLRTLSDLRNPRSFVRKKVLDGADLGLDDLGLDDVGLDDVGLDDEKNGKRTNGASKARNGASGKASRNGAAEKPAADTDRRTPAAGPSTPAASSSTESPSTSTTSADTSPSASSATPGAGSTGSSVPGTGSSGAASPEPAPEAGATRTVASPSAHGDAADADAPQFDPDAT